MKSNFVTIDGAETRKQIDIIAGRKNGTAKICREKGFSSTVLNTACRDGKITIESYTRAIQKGIPIVTNKDAITSKIRDRHAPASKDEVIEVKERSIDEFQRLQQLSIDDAIELTKADQIKEIMIMHLTAMIEDLKNI